MRPQDSKALWLVSWMSFAWSCSTLMIFAILPAFLIDELGVSHLHLGLMEGVAVGASFASKVFAGVASDLTKNRKTLIVYGSFFSACAKIFFAFAPGLYWVFSARFLDRVSKGFRSAPTDALIADLSGKRFYGHVYGIRQGMYTLGAVFGAALAMLIMHFSNNNYRLVFTLSGVPAFLAVILACYLRNPQQEKTHTRKTSYLKKGWFRSLIVHFPSLKRLPRFYWFTLAIVAILMMARFSEAFLTLKVKELGCPISCLPLVIVLMDIVHAAVAVFCGKLTDRFSAAQLLLFGLSWFVFTHLLVMLADNLLFAYLGLVAVGVHMGMTQGLLRVLIAQATPKNLRGTGFSLFYLVSGCSILIGNSLAGYLSQSFGLSYAFLGGASLSLAAAFSWYLVLKFVPQDGSEFVFANEKAKTTLS